jgi:hypothetical protein
MASKNTGLLASLKNLSTPLHISLCIYFYPEWEIPGAFFGGCGKRRCMAMMPNLGMPDLQTSTGSTELQEVERVRSVFPETWLWQNVTVRLDLKKKKSKEKKRKESRYLHGLFGM